MAKFEMNPGFEAEMAAKLQELVQDAVDVTTRAKEENGLTDIPPFLRAQLEQRGLDDIDEAWLNELSEQIRDSRVVIVSGPLEDDEDDGR